MGFLLSSSSSWLLKLPITNKRVTYLVLLGALRCTFEHYIFTFVCFLFFFFLPFFLRFCSHKSPSLYSSLTDVMLSRLLMRKVFEQPRLVILGSCHLWSNHLFWRNFARNALGWEGRIRDKMQIKMFKIGIKIKFELMVSLRWGSVLSGDLEKKKFEIIYGTSNHGIHYVTLLLPRRSPLTSKIVWR